MENELTLRENDANGALSGAGMSECCTVREILLTQEQMAIKLGVSVPTISVRLARLGLKPIVEANRKLGIAALYDLNVFFNLEEEEESKLKAERERIERRRIDLLSDENKMALRTGQAIKIAFSEDGTPEQRAAIEMMAAQGRYIAGDITVEQLNEKYINDPIAGALLQQIGSLRDHILQIEENHKEDKAWMRQHFEEEKEELRALAKGHKKPRTAHEKFWDMAYQLGTR